MHLFLQIKLLWGKSASGAEILHVYQITVRLLSSPVGFLILGPEMTSVFLINRWMKPWPRISCSSPFPAQMFEANSRDTASGATSRLYARWQRHHMNWLIVCVTIMLMAELPDLQYYCVYIFALQVRIYRHERKCTRFYSTALISCTYLSWVSSSVRSMNLNNGSGRKTGG